MQPFTISLRSSRWRTHRHEDLLVRVLGVPADEKALVTASVLEDKHALGSQAGNWAVIVEAPDSVTLIQDNLRSFPLFYSTITPVHVSDDIELLRTLVDDGGFAPESAQEFLYQAFVTGNQTLFRNIHQAQSGEWVRICTNGTVQRERLRRLHYSGKNLTDEQALDENFTKALDVTISRALEWVGDRQVVIPLSGGLDSRLLAVEMRERGVQNLVTFTYGIGETREVAISRQVASDLGLRWEFISYSLDELREAWAQEDTATFIADTYSGSALPHIQDWYALRHMRTTALIDDDAVMFPGHCIVGMMHDEDIVDSPVAPSREQMKRLIFGHHAAIRSDAEKLWKSPAYQAKLDQFLDEEGYNGTPVSRLTVLENYNVFERQTKYINNSVRAYEHFGYDWSLPLLDLEMFEAWEDLDPQIAKDRDWFRRYVNRRYAAASGSEIGEFTASDVSAGKRDLIKRLLRVLGLLTPVERRLTLRAIESHPMGFHTFLGTATEKDLRREVLHGGTQMGIHTEQFLAGTWSRAMQPLV